MGECIDLTGQKFGLLTVIKREENLMKKYNVAILGATGAVGGEFLKLIEERNFPFAELRLLASKRSAGTEIEFMGKTYVVQEATKDSFQGIDIAMDVGAAHLVVQQVLGELLGHALGEGDHEGALVALGTHEDLFHEVVDLIERGAHVDDGVEQACGADELFGHDTLALDELVVGRGGAYVDDLIDPLCRCQHQIRGPFPFFGFYI